MPQKYSPDVMAAFTEKLIALYKPGPSGSEVDAYAVKALVEQDVDLVATVFPYLLRMCTETGSKIWGLLFVVANVYERVNRGDDSLLVTLKAGAERVGVELPRWHVKPSDAPAAPAIEAGDRKIIGLQIVDADLLSGSALRMKKLLGPPAMTNGLSPTLKQMFLSCHLLFNVVNDQREVWEIPEVRRYVGALHAEIPFFPMYLLPDPGTHFVYFASLAQPALITREGVLFMLDREHVDTVRHVSTSYASITAVCKMHGLDPLPFLEPLLSPYPDSIREAYLKRARESDD